MPLRLTDDEFSRLKRGAAPPKKRTHKFRARVAIDGDGVRFDSEFEASHWGELKLREKIGEIQKLRRQVPIPLVVNGIVVGKFIADFEYEERGVHAHDRRWTKIVEDAKSEFTRRLPVYRLKYRIMQAMGITIREVVKRSHRGNKR